MGNWAGAVELALVFGAVLGFGVWQLVSVRRDSRAAEKNAPREPKRDPGEPP